MSVGDGKFVLYPNIAPVLTAGDYRFTSTQSLATATGPDGGYQEADLPVSTLDTHVRVRSPRYFLPPDQVLSTFPPANSEGSYGMRLPQIVIKRRTLPWERTLVEGRADLPWLALVLIAEGEAELTLNQPVAECVSSDRPLAGVADAERGNYLAISKSKIDQIFPTQLDVALLAHAREVDINDTELMLGDDDGFLAVVIANRLPLAATDDDGEQLPVRYLACLVNLEGQFDRLLATAPGHDRFTTFSRYTEVTYVSAASTDHAAMQLASTELAAFGGADVAGRYSVQRSRTELAGSATVSATASGKATASAWGSATYSSSADIYGKMASGFDRAIVTAALDPTYRFPVLLYWSFTSVGDTTFRSLMEDLDSGLLGTVPEPDDVDPNAPALAGRLPLELVETGHVGLAQSTRQGDPVRCWYRGPLLAHPTIDTVDDRLPVAHAADQLRIVVPDGREDLSLASAFEIGRLLALAKPSVLAAMLAWRQTSYQTARQRTIWNELDTVHFGGLLSALELDGAGIGRFLERSVVSGFLTAPDEVLGRPNPLVRPGRQVEALLGATGPTIAKAFGFDPGILKGDLATVLDNLATQPVITGEPDTKRTSRAVADALDQHLLGLVNDTLGKQVEVVDGGGVRHVGIKRGARRRADALDALVEELREGDHR